MSNKNLCNFQAVFGKYDTCFRGVGQEKEHSFTTRILPPGFPASLEQKTAGPLR